jgi:hypothetical protein
MKLHSDLTIDENLTWKYHVDNITKKVSSGIGALKRMRDFISQKLQFEFTKVLWSPIFPVVPLFGMA